MVKKSWFPELVNNYGIGIFKRSKLKVHAYEDEFTQNKIEGFFNRPTKLRDI